MPTVCRSLFQRASVPWRPCGFAFRQKPSQLSPPSRYPGSEEASDFPQDFPSQVPKEFYVISQFALKCALSKGQVGTYPTKEFALLEISLIHGQLHVAVGRGPSLRLARVHETAGGVCTRGSPVSQFPAAGFPSLIHHSDFTCICKPVSAAYNGYK